MDAGKTCTKCNEWKPYAEFHRDKSTKDGRAYRCKTCAIAAATAWNSANHDRINQRRRDNPGLYRESRRRSYRKNAQKRMQTTRDWMKRKPAQRRSHIHRARARVENPGIVRQEEWDALMERYGGRCLRCGTTEDVYADHIVPLAKGGMNTIDNVQPLCRSCNAKKWTYVVDYRPDKKAA
jgi:5-methylcytosine-specific restriction endonuclease McrA